MSPSLVKLGMNAVVAIIAAVLTLVSLSSSAGLICEKCSELAGLEKDRSILYHTNYPGSINVKLKESQEVINSLYLEEIVCDGCAGYYSSSLIRANVPLSYLSHPPSMYHLFHRLGQVYPGGHFHTIGSDGIFYYESWIPSLKPTIDLFATSYSLQNRLSYLTSSQEEGYWLYTFSIVKLSVFNLVQNNFSVKFDLRSLGPSPVKLLGLDLHDVSSLRSISHGETRVGVILETNIQVRELLLKALHHLNSMDVIRGVNNSQSHVKDSFIQFIRQSEHQSETAHSDVSRLLGSLFDLESTVQLDASWINTYLIFGCLNANLDNREKASGAVVEIDNGIFCEVVRIILPRLFSTLVNCTSYVITPDLMYLENSVDDSDEGRIHYNSVDIVRNELMRRCVLSSDPSLQFDYIVLVNDRSTLPGEGWMRSSIFHMRFSTIAQDLGILVLTSLLDGAFDPPLALSSIIVSRSFLNALTSMNFSEYCDSSNDVMDLMFSRNRSKTFNDVALLWSLSLANILKPYQYKSNLISHEKFVESLSSISEDFASYQTLIDKIQLMFRVFVGSLYERYWIDGDFNASLPASNIKKEQTVKPRVAYITAVYGNYELSCKRHAYQTVAADFICFTDNPNIVANNWLIDTTPYHAIFWKNQTDSDFAYFKERNISKEELMMAKNSYNNNMHPFNVAKFYKTNFPWIPRLKEYDVVVWLDGTISVHNSQVTARLLELVDAGEGLITFDLRRWGRLRNEAEMSMLSEKYTTATFNNLAQPIQHVDSQYEAYLLSGYDDENYWVSGGRFEQIYKEKLASQPGQLNRPHRGVFCTCFIAYDMRRAESRDFLALWFEQILFLSTQDQISFPFVAQILHTKVFSLPDDTVMYGEFGFNEWFNKLNHGV